MTQADGKVAEFFATHPQVDAVDTLLCDLSGVLRGTRLDRNSVSRLAAGGYVLESAIFAMDIRGNIVEATGLGAAEGYADRPCVMIENSLLPAPWLGPQLAQVQVSMVEQDGRPYFGDPRHVLKGLSQRLRQLGLRAVIAIELEFYLVDSARGASGEIQPPLSPQRRHRAGHSRINRMDDMAEHSALVQEIRQACAIQGVLATTSIVEYGPGQYEINLHHVADPCDACDQAVRFRRIVKGVALRHGMIATFMAQPYREWTGSGMHVHVSLLDESGANVFADANGADSARLRHCIGGLLASMPDAMAVFAPNPNSYRRLRRGGFVPVAATWGANHRGVAVRLPHADGANRRFEHRVAGADANPYLVVSAILAGLLHGWERCLDPGEPLMPGAEHPPAHATALPDYWREALDRFESSKVMRDAFGERFVHLYAAVKRHEFEEFAAHVSPLEHELYLDAL